ncbi:FxLYD domain-containing protein [Halegenticoccus soli]|uniref:FxLYD domain-containing protein n=1 Tax=Halegenticoccus soli TaxID=1985678 RepID=UPI00117B380D|nr:FxLYD domain-containing protein [Halegenticoccus soli]
MARTYPRREILVAGGSALAVSLAGCSGIEGIGDDGADGQDSPSPTDGEPSPAGGTDTPDATDSPTPEETTGSETTTDSETTSDPEETSTPEDTPEETTEEETDTPEETTESEETTGDGSGSDGGGGSRRVEIVDHTLLGDEYDGSHLVGTVKNVSDETLASVEVRATFYDAEGNRLDSVTWSAEDVDPGETIEFELQTDAEEPNVDRYEVEATASN